MQWSAISILADKSEGKEQIEWLRNRQTHLVVHELQSESRFADTTTADHDDFMDNGLSGFGRFGCHFLWLLVFDSRWWVARSLLFKYQSLEPTPTAMECAPPVVTVAHGRAGRSADWLLAAAAGRLVGGGRVGWPSKSEDLGLVGILSAFLDGLNNWNANRVRPLGHWLADRLPIFPNFDSHFYRFVINKSGKTRMTSTITNTRQPDPHGIDRKDTR